MNGNKLIAIVISLFALQICLLLSLPYYLAHRGIYFSESALGELGNALALSVVSSALSSTVVLALSAPAGYALSRERIPYKRFILPFLLMFSAISPAAIGLTLLIFFGATPWGRALHELFNIINDWKGVVIAQIAVGLPLGISYFVSVFASVPRSLEEVAYVLGYSKEETFFKVIVPMHRVEVLGGFMILFSRAFGEFGASLIMGGGIKGKTVTLPIYLYYTYQMGELPIVVAVLIAYIIPSFGLLALLTSIQFREGEADVIS